MHHEMITWRIPSNKKVSYLPTVEMFRQAPIHHAAGKPSQPLTSLWGTCLSAYVKLQGCFFLWASNTYNTKDIQGYYHASVPSFDILWSGKQEFVVFLVGGGRVCEQEPVYFLTCWVTKNSSRVWELTLPSSMEVEHGPHCQSPLLIGAHHGNLLPIKPWGWMNFNLLSTWIRQTLRPLEAAACFFGNSTSPRFCKDIKDDFLRIFREIAIEVLPLGPA